MLYRDALTEGGRGLFVEFTVKAKWQVLAVLCFWNFVLWYHAISLRNPAAELPWSTSQSDTLLFVGYTLVNRPHISLHRFCAKVAAREKPHDGWRLINLCAGYEARQGEQECRCAMQKCLLRLDARYPIILVL